MWLKSWLLIRSSMNYLFYYTVFFLLLFVAANSASAQSPQKKEILRELNTSVPGKGHVSVYEDESISHVLGRSIAPSRTVYTNSTGSTQFYRVRGFKIQAFSGNDQRTSKNEAHRKQQSINNSYPGLETVVLFESPFWRLRVGNFKTREEADQVLKEMAKTFPSFGKEMYVVVDEVKIPVNQN